MNFDSKERTYYEILGIPHTASEKQIASTYRNAALKYHPDKNPSADAARQFEKISRAYTIISDHSARAAYDAVLLARAAKHQRDLAMAGKRRELKDELLRREAEARKQRTDEEDVEKRFAAEVERLRKKEYVILKQKNAPGESISDRTLKLVSIVMDPLVEHDIINSVAGVENVFINKNKTTAEVLFFTIADAKKALDSIYPTFKLSPKLDDRIEKESIKMPFNEYEDITLKHLQRASES